MIYVAGKEYLKNFREGLDWNPWYSTCVKDFIMPVKSEVGILLKDSEKPKSLINCLSYDLNWIRADAVRLWVCFGGKNYFPI